MPQPEIRFDDVWLLFSRSLSRLLLEPQHVRRFVSRWLDCGSVDTQLCKAISTTTARHFQGSCKRVQKRNAVGKKQSLWLARELANLVPHGGIDQLEVGVSLHLFGHIFPSWRDYGRQQQHRAILGDGIGGVDSTGTLRQPPTLATMPTPTDQIGHRVAGRGAPCADEVSHVEHAGQRSASYCLCHHLIEELRNKG
jgi:hypothetical protein